MFLGIKELIEVTVLSLSVPVVEVGSPGIRIGVPGLTVEMHRLGSALGLDNVLVREHAFGISGMGIIDGLGSWLGVRSWALFGLVRRCLWMELRWSGLCGSSADSEGRGSRDRIRGRVWEGVIRAQGSRGAGIMCVGRPGAGSIYDCALVSGIHGAPKVLAGRGELGVDLSGQPRCGPMGGSSVVCVRSVR